MDCYKTILKDLCEFDETWAGLNAKWFEECDRSNNAQIILFEEELRKETEDKLWYGTADPWSVVFCKPMPGIYTPMTVEGAYEPASSRYAKLAYKTLANYFMRKTK